MDLYATLVDMENLMHKPVRQMSLGQRTLCDILASFLHNPGVVFLDEPTIGLDVAMKAKIRELIAAATCFWVVHSFFALALSNTLRDYAKYPVTIFNKVLRGVFTFIIPVGFMAFYPSQIFLRPDSISPIVWLTPAFGAFFFYSSYKIWMKGAMSFNGTGS